MILTLFIVQSFSKWFVHFWMTFCKNSIRISFQIIFVNKHCPQYNCVQVPLKDDTYVRHLYRFLTTLSASHGAVFYIWVFGFFTHARLLQPCTLIWIFVFAYIWIYRQYKNHKCVNVLMVMHASHFDGQDAFYSLF